MEWSFCMLSVSYGGGTHGADATRTNKNSLKFVWEFVTKRNGTGKHLLCNPLVYCTLDKYLSAPYRR